MLSAMALRTKTRSRPRLRGDRYGSYSQLLHWATAAVICAIVPVGLAMVAAPTPDLRRPLFEWHQSLGASVWMMTLLRLWARRATPTPQPETAMFRWQVLLADMMHFALYGLLLAMPVFGYGGAAFLRQPTTLFGLFTIPAPPLPDWQVLGAALLAIHRTLAWAMMLLLIVHVGIALYHHFVARDRTLRRMLPERLDPTV